MQTVTVPMESLAEVIRLQLEYGGKATLTVTGNSMYPLLKSHRDSVMLIMPQELKTGDVVLFQRGSGAYILHRIIGATQEDYVCCGDNQVIRERVSREQIIAVMAGFIRKGKQYSVQMRLYRVYSAIWMRIFGLRQIYDTCKHCLGRLRRKLRNAFKKK